jgi:hypothetical protein
MAQIMSLFLVLLLVSQSGSKLAQVPEFSFQVQTEKQVFKPGEPIWVLATLRNESDHDIFIPHAMTPCFGLESQITFSLLAKGRDAATGTGRGCGFGSGCSHCPVPPSLEERVKTSWVLLHPSEIFGARIDSYENAPNSPGEYTLQAEYSPQKLVNGKTLGPEGNQIYVIAQSYKSPSVKIIVRR